MVEGLNSIVAFKTNDNYGNGLSATGSIISSKGDTVTTFQSTETGMGLFSFMPAPNETYRVEGYFGKDKINTALPPALKKGIALHISTDSTSIKIDINTNEPMFTQMQGKPISIVIKHAGDKVYSGQIMLGKPNISATIPTNDLPPGLAVLTIFDDLGRPNCERLLFIQSPHKIKFTLSTNKEIYNTQEKVILNVKATDYFGQPVKTSFSLAAVDGLSTDESGNIVAYLMLQSEIKGEIKNVNQYFDPTNLRRFKQLDLLLLTQGWRTYLWRKLADSTLKISYLPEPGITIKGMVREKLADKPLANMNITLFGSGFTGNKIFFTKTDATGAYFLDGLNWYGNQAIKISSQDNKGKKGGWLRIDTLVKPFPIHLKLNPQLEVPLAFNTEISKRMAYYRTYKTGDSILLDEVKIVKNKTRMQLFDQTLTTFGFPDQVFNITAADYSYRSLEHFLLTKADGSQSADDLDSVSNEGVTFLVGGKKVRPRIIVNNSEDLFDRIDYYSLTMDQINQITIRQLMGQSGNAVFVILLNLKESALLGPNLHLLNVNLNGYYNARNFYSPNYAVNPVNSKDLRTTIFWTPALKTNANGETNVTFFNSNNNGNVIITANGITESGTAMANKTTYKVQ